MLTVFRYRTGFVTECTAYTMQGTETVVPELGREETQPGDRTPECFQAAVHAKEGVHHLRAWGAIRLRGAKCAASNRSVPFSQPVSYTATHIHEYESTIGMRTEVV